MHGFEPGFYVDVGPYLNVKREMLASHKSQLARGKDEDFSPLEELMVRQAKARGAQSGIDAAEAFRIHRAWKRTAAW